MAFSLIAPTNCHAHSFPHFNRQNCMQLHHTHRMQSPRPLPVFYHPSHIARHTVVKKERVCKGQIKGSLQRPNIPLQGVWGSFYQYMLLMPPDNGSEFKKSCILGAFCNRKFMQVKGLNGKFLFAYMHRPPSMYAALIHTSTSVLSIIR